jgi:FlaA1/EpsC-like NDP-sugar epimerase
VRLRAFICFCIESLIVITAVLLSAVMRLSVGNPIVENSLPYVPDALLIALMCQICMYYADLYDFRAALSSSKLFIKLLQSLATATVVLAMLFYLVPSAIIGRGVLSLSLILSFCLLMGWRLLYQWLFSTQQFKVNVLIIGTGEEAQKLAGELSSNRPLGYDIRGFIGESSDVGKDVL